jgi:hypothetical protein
LVVKQREFEIEAAMVRVMKARNRFVYSLILVLIQKRSDWNQLQVEVINILKNRFAPDAKLLKKRLESLIDRK